MKYLAAIIDAIRMLAAAIQRAIKTEKENKLAKEMKKRDDETTEKALRDILQ